MTTITNNYLDIQNLIRIAYDFFYNKNTTLCYSMKPVNLSDVETYQSIKRILDVSQAPVFVNSMLNDRLTFVKKMLVQFGNKYIMKKINDPYSVDLTFYIYNSNDENNLSSSQNISKVFLKLFSDFVTYKQSRHILIQILNVDVEYMYLDDFFATVPELQPMLNIDNIGNKVVSISITEHFFKMLSLVDCLDKYTDNEYAALIFQVLHTLAIIQHKYPSFRHNNLNVKYMDGYIFSDTSTNPIKYVYGSKHYNVTNIGFSYKMSNFESATIVDVLPNENIDDKLRTHNKLYDIQTFLASLREHIKGSHEKTNAFIEKYINIENIELHTIFDDDYFNDFIVDNDKIKNKKSANIENKLSSRELEQMSKPSFLHKGTRKLNSNNVESTQQDVLHVGTRGTSKQTKYDRDEKKGYRRDHSEMGQEPIERDHIDDDVERDHVERDHVDRDHV